MKKASKIVLIIAGASSVLSLLSLLIVGLVMISQAVVGTGFSEILTAIEEVVKETDPSLDAEALKAIVMGVYIGGIIFSMCYLGLFTFIIAILSFLGAFKGKKGLYIATIVFSVLGGGQILPLLGSIFGLIGEKQANN